MPSGAQQATNMEPAQFAAPDRRPSQARGATSDASIADVALAGLAPLSGLASLQAAADASDATAQLRSLQHAANAGPAAQNLSALQRRQDLGDEFGEQPVVGETAGPQSRFDSMTAIDSGRPSSDTRQNYRNSTILQRQVSPNHVPHQPALVGPASTPVASPVLDQAGIRAVSMPDADYAGWKGTAQAKMKMHGAASHGGRTYVTQLKSSGELLQMIEWGDVFSRKNLRAVLVIAEGALAVAAGSLAIAAATGGAFIALLPGIAIAVSGVIKIFRGLYMMFGKDGTEEEKAHKARLVNIMRAIESAATLVAAISLGFASKEFVATLVFGLAKAIRSGLAFAKEKWPQYATKFEVAMHFCHLIEVGAIAAGAIGAIGSGDAVATGLGFAIAGSKLTRTGEGSQETFAKARSNPATANTGPTESSRLVGGSSGGEKV